MFRLKTTAWRPYSLRKEIGNYYNVRNQGLPWRVVRTIHGHLIDLCGIVHYITLSAVIAFAGRRHVYVRYRAGS